MRDPASTASLQSRKVIIAGRLGIGREQLSCPTLPGLPSLAIGQLAFDIVSAGGQKLAWRDTGNEQLPPATPSSDCLVELPFEFTSLTYDRAKRVELSRHHGRNDSLGQSILSISAPATDNPVSPQSPTVELSMVIDRLAFDRLAFESRRGPVRRGLFGG